MTNPTDLERITDKLEQAGAIMAFLHGTSMIAAVRVLLSGVHRDAMPTEALRAQWLRIAETIVRLGRGVTWGQAHSLDLEIAQLRQAILKHIAGIMLLS
jgi:hypothetical protein